MPLICMSSEPLLLFVSILSLAKRTVSLEVWEDLLIFLDDDHL
jgi:hypothetical protein